MFDKLVNSFISFLKNAIDICCDNYKKELDIQNKNLYLLSSNDKNSQNK